MPITIPKYISSNLNSSAESLNASIAAAIICYEFRRKQSS
jgi:tRNA G18 (ribose-2'-O)-methylase SpoU